MMLLMGGRDDDDDDTSSSPPHIILSREDYSFHLSSQSRTERVEWWRLSIKHDGER